jgi:hypothetical protein
MHQAGTEPTSDIEEESKMKLCNNGVPSLFQASVSVTNGENSRQPIHRKSAGLPNRVRGVECMLADIQAQIKRLQQERTYLRLVRETLVSRGVERNKSSLRTTSRKETGSRVQLQPQDQLT